MHIHRSNPKPRVLAGAAAAALVLGLGTPQAGAETRSTLNLYGVSGLIDMPSGRMQPDAELSVTGSAFGPNRRGTLTFQITPWLQGSFRYIGIDGLAVGGFGPNDVYYDRSFDLRLRLLQESAYLPSVTVGLQDFIGTGQFAAEYIAATKHLSPRLAVTAGLGWGRFGSYNPVGSPTGNRPTGTRPTGGTVNAKQWFRGPMSVFGGVEWQPNDRLGLKLEYSTDAYDLEDRRQGIFDRRTQLNFGAEYQYSASLRLGAYYLYGEHIGISAQYAFNPRIRSAGGTGGPGPLPVTLRPDRRTAPAAWDTGWTGETGAVTGLRDRLAQALEGEGLVVEALSVTATRAELRIRNLRYDAAAQAIGRGLRAMTGVMPASVEQFDVVVVSNAMPLSRVRVNRSDIEALEHAPDNANALRARAALGDAGPLPRDAVLGAGLYPRFQWALSPYARLSAFDPDNPLRGDLGLRLSGRYDIAPGLVLSGAVAKKIVGNLDSSTRPSNSILPRVRSEANIYDRADPVLEKLTLAWYGRAGPNLYARMTAGYLERMFGGVSAEVLWKRVDSPFALGAEVNYVKQRDFDQRFGFRDYKIATGHVSAYYAFGNGYHGQVDVGRYLAGDWGATLSLDHEFSNGWRVGAFATLTDVSFTDFGEGSFDKGIRLQIPLAWVTGNPSLVRSNTTIRPVLRDGGARLDVEGRLYEDVRRYHSGALDGQWGRVWR